MNTPDRILYKDWINSQLSVARFYGGINYNGASYVIEPKTNDLVKWVTIEPKKGKKKP